MKIAQIIKDNLSQIFAITEKNLSLRFRFKNSIFLTIVKPLFFITMPLIIMMQFFQFNAFFGPWTIANFLIFQFIAYNLYLLKIIITEMPMDLQYEKFWKTLPSLIIAPFNRFNLLFGILFSYIIIILIPFVICFVLCYMYFPISFITIFAVIGVYFLIILIFSGIGIILSIFAISNENFWNFFYFIIEIIFWFSCITYPYQFFPYSIQQIINLNPFYYFFDFLRWLWIEDDIIFTLEGHYRSFIILVICSITFPCIGVYLFNVIYKKYGIVGQ